VKISIRGLRFEAILGILDFERLKPQPIEIECHITYRYESGEYLDYAEAAKTLESTMKEGKFYLIEEALDALFQKMAEKFPRIETIEIAVSKPDILPNCRVCVSDSRSYL